MIFPGSPLAKKNPRWVMAAELVETSRLFARTVARIQPEWIEPLAGHLVRRTYSEPHWSRKRAAAVAVERVTLHGVPIVVDRRVDYGRIDPETSRDLFIRHALVEGDWDTRHPFFHANRALLEDVEELETRARRRDLVRRRGDAVRLLRQPHPGATSSPGGTSTAGGRSSATRALLDFTEEMVRTAQAAAIDPSAYPDHVEAGGLTLPLSYAFEPGRQRRRDHRRRAGGGVAPGGPDAVHLAGAGAARGAGHGADQDAAQDPATAVRACARPRPCRARPAATRVTSRCSTAWSASWAGCAASRSRATPGSSTGCPSTSPSRSGSSTSAAVEVARGTDLEALRRELAPQVAAELAAADVTQHRAHHVDDRRAAARDRGAARAGTSSPGTRAWSTAATPSTSGCSRPPPSATPPTPAASAACCCSTPPRPPARCSAASTARPPRARPQPARLGRRPRRRLRHGRRRRADQRGGRARLGRARLRPAARRSSRNGWPGTTQQVLDAVRGVLTVWHRVQARSPTCRTGCRATSPPSSTPSSAPASSPATAPPGWPTSPATWRRPSGGSRSCASTRPATRRGRRRSPSSPTSTRSSWPPSRRAPSRRPRCARSAG